jgi:hypothetical protein
MSKLRIIVKCECGERLVNIEALEHVEGDLWIELPEHTCARDQVFAVAGIPPEGGVGEP